MHGLDVEGLLAVPALRPALVDLVEAVRAGGDLAELAGPNCGWWCTRLYFWASWKIVGAA